MRMDLKELLEINDISVLRNIVNLQVSSTGRFHFCEHAIDCVHSRSIEEQGVADYKPLGLWFSVGKSWIDFLISESEFFFWSVESLNATYHIYEMVIDRNKIIKLKTDKDFLNFTEQYGILLPSCKTVKYPFLINWQKVARDWSGIETKFKDRRDEDFLWYNGWDCDSGVIWDKKSVLKFQELHNFK